MRPADHPDFFDRPPPEGRSRESTIRLDARGRFWHEGRLVEHAPLRAAFHAWIARHPRDGRYILSNGYDWTYFTVEDAPFFVTRVRIEPQGIMVVLSDGSEEAWEPETTRVSAEGALYALVKCWTPGGGFEAKFTPHAQSSLGPVLVEPRGEARLEGSDTWDEHEWTMPRVALGARVACIGTSRGR